ncbi:MAG: ribosome biogenesis GTPase Der [Acholeplasmataceae bacterium]|jgi:GTP-binding protein|nr:ribosome biogenesis GTPase Der [Acholeplasmataceae bacterium]
MFQVAIVGRPNVGKSSLFNRIIGERKAITDDIPGVTRDRIYGRATWLTKSFGVIDTGGIETGDAPFLEQIKAQALLAVNEADLIIFLVDAKSGITETDEVIKRLLFSFKKDVILAVNKVDNHQMLSNVYEFYSLGFGDPIGISATHGIGIGDLLDKVISYIDDSKMAIEDDSIKLAVVGYPNVGKSSLTNAILGEPRVIVSNIPGTTRDAVDTRFKYNNKDYTIIDTAGIKKSGQIYESTDRYALLRALRAIERADVVLFVIDASRDLINQDKHVAGLALEYGKAVLIVINKWDLVEKDTNTMSEYEKKVREEFQFLTFAPILFVSSIEGKRLHTIFEAVDIAYRNFEKKLATNVLNEFLLNIVAFNPPKLFNKGQAKFSYMTQVSVKPPTFVLFVNNPKYVHFSYERYIENRLRETFDFEGTPIKLILRKKE